MYFKLVCRFSKQNIHIVFNCLSKTDNLFVFVDVCSCFFANFLFLLLCVSFELNGFRVESVGWGCSTVSNWNGEKHVIYRQTNWTISEQTDGRSDQHALKWLVKAATISKRNHSYVLMLPFQSHRNHFAPPLKPPPNIRLYIRYYGLNVGCCALVVLASNHSFEDIRVEIPGIPNTGHCADPLL